MASRPFVEVEDIEEFFENAALSLHWVGPDGTIIRANKFELDFLGYGRDEYEGRHIAEFHVDRNVIEDILARLSRGETLNDYPARLRAKDGSMRHVLINSNVRWVDGQFVHTRCFTRDITDRVRMQQELAEANERLEQTVDQRTTELREANEQLRELMELKDRFVAIVSHELRTPLTSIAGFSTTMQRLWDSLADDRKRDFVQIIGDQSERLTRLVNDLLTLSRLSSGTFAVDERPVDVRETVEQTVRELAAEGVEVRCAPGLTVHADEDYLRQILVNYLANALKYGRPPIVVDAKRAGDAVEICVCDHGEGVAPDFRDRLFAEFAHRGLVHDAGSGTGLGLAIVRQLAEAHGGEAWYEPNEPSGATFCVRLPAA